MARLRLIRECFQVLKSADPDTSLTLRALRRLVEADVVPSIRSGRKVLVDYNQLLAYLSRPYEPKPVENHCNSIRPVNRNQQ